MVSTSNLNPTLPLEKQALLNILHTQACLLEKMNEVFKAHDLSGEQFNVLRILRGQKGSPANMCLIQERMIAKTSNTTRLVDKLLAKGLVTREVCPQNRRKIEVQITQKGLDLLQLIGPEVDAKEKMLVGNFTPKELQTLITLLDKFTK
ncbi:MAG: MarR family transcriptional regulator [Flavobacterium sp.]|nr:MAG: MarR family transcriptional regulator [Flavobacterium sp.]